MPDSPHHSANPAPADSPAGKGLSVYLHVPFCLSHCIYCDFYVVLEKHGGKEAYVEAVLQEIQSRFVDVRQAGYTHIRTFYVGGGTPSLLPAEAYTRIFAAVQKFLPFAPDAEITLEANPGGKREGMASASQAYLDAGFNRISVGVQSLQDTELQKLSRIHNATEAEAFIRQLKADGWENISLDLMYAVPGQTMESWRETLAKAVGLGVQHISMYGLKIEEGTALERLLQAPQHQYAIPDDEANVAMYFEALAFLKTNGYQRYEFSNLARPGFESRHNTHYWDNGEYLALGASAHGYWQDMRIENVRDLLAYLANPMAGESTPCPPQERLENAIIFGLRKAEGIDIPAIEAEFGFDFQREYGRVLAKFSPDYLQLSGDHLALRESAIPLSNAILAEFMR